MLTAKYIAIYKICGIARLDIPTQDIELASLKAPNVVFRLTTNPEPYCAPIDHRLAVADVHLDSIFSGGSLTGNLSDRLNERVEMERAARQKKMAGSGAYLIVFAEDESLTLDQSNQQDYVDFAIVWDAIPVGHFSKLVEQPLNTMLVSIAALLPSNYSGEVALIGQVAYFSDEATDKPIYSATIQGSMRGYISGGVQESNLTAIKALFLCLTNDRQLETPTRLYARSIRAAEGDLRAFLAAWAALEIFINKTFSDYHKIWKAKLRDAAHPVAERYFTSIDRAVGDKLNLLDKFSIIAALLNPQNANDDVDQFSVIKAARDKFYHAQEVEPAPRPSLELLAKYLRLHFEIDKKVSPPSNSENLQVPERNSAFWSSVLCWMTALPTLLKIKLLRALRLCTHVKS